MQQEGAKHAEVDEEKAAALGDEAVCQLCSL
jgi:hypothetical protein